MSILTANQLAQLRQELERRDVEINYNKAQVNAAFQALEDWYQSAAIQTALSTTIDTATAPLVLTNQQKVALICVALRRLSNRLCGV